MNAKLSFEERLRAKRLEEEKMRVIEATDKLAKQRLEEEYRKQIKDAYQRHISFGGTTVLPILNTVNSAYLGGRGKLIVIPTSAFGCSYRKDYKIGSWLIWKLSWDEEQETLLSRHGDGDIIESWGNNIILQLWLDGKIQVFAGLISISLTEERKPINGSEQLNINNPNDIDRIKELIIRAIEDISCFYSD